MIFKQTFLISDFDENMVIFEKTSLILVFDGNIMMTRKIKSQPENFRDSFWCYKIEILVRVLGRIKREKIFEKAQMIHVKVRKVGKVETWFTS